MHKKKPEHIYVDKLESMLKVESAYLSELSENFGKEIFNVLDERFDELVKFYALNASSITPKLLFCLPLKEKMKLGFTLKYEFTDIDKSIFFSFKTFRWEKSAPSHDIVISGDLSHLSKKFFYIKFFGLLSCFIFYFDVLAGRIKVRGKRNMFKLLIWEGSWLKGLIKSLGGLDIKLVVQVLSDDFLIEDVISHFNIKKNILFLDAGCGSGRIARKIRKLGFQVVAMDVSLIELRKISDQQILKVVADLTNPPLKSTVKFDTIFLLEVIEHLNEKHGSKLIDVLSPHLKKNGLMVLSTPNPRTPRQRILRKIERIPKDESIIWPFHYKEYGVSELKKMFIGKGFRVNKVIGQHDLDIPFAILLKPFKGISEFLVRKFPKLSYDYIIICEKIYEGDNRFERL